MAAFVYGQVFRGCVLHAGYMPEGCSTRAVFEVKTGVLVLQHPTGCYAVR